MLYDCDNIGDPSHAMAHAANCCLLGITDAVDAKLAVNAYEDDMLLLDQLEVP